MLTDILPPSAQVAGARPESVALVLPEPARPTPRTVGEDSIWAISEREVFDVLIVGAGVAGSFIAEAVAQAGKTCLVLEAGRHFPLDAYPRNEVDATAQLYWSGGVELNQSADIGLLRPKAVGGGSIVNQALVDRFDAAAFDPWREKAGIDWLSVEEMAPWYDRAESKIAIQYIPAERRNGNARIFEEGFLKNGFRCAPLRRAQRDCRYDEGNDCIECLAGCPIQSKQSMPWTTLARARSTGNLRLVARFEVHRIEEQGDFAVATGVTPGGLVRRFKGRRLVLASGAVGNSKVLLQSEMGARLPAVGRGFFTHPQYMNLALYDRPVNAHKGAFQAFKSDDPAFRKAGFKLENVFAPPANLAMVLPGVGREVLACMRDITRLACIEVAVRDTAPGRIGVVGQGKLRIVKELNGEDRRRREAGRKAVEAIFRSTGARKLIPSGFGIGLHLMGGCGLGRDPAHSVVGADFRLHGSKRVFAADSSVFPDAPGLNPSLTVMALALRAALEVVGP